MKCFSPERLSTIRALAKNYLVRQLVRLGAGPDESQPRLRALRHVLRPRRQRPRVVHDGHRAPLRPQR